jgi:hypothetical protein
VLDLCERKRLFVKIVNETDFCQSGTERYTVSFSVMEATPRVEADSKVNMEFSRYTQESVHRSAIIAGGHVMTDYLRREQQVHFDRCQRCCSSTRRTALLGICQRPYLDRVERAFKSAPRRGVVNILAISSKSTKCARLVSHVLSVIFEQHKLTVGHFEIWGPVLVV